MRQNPIASSLEAPSPPRPINVARLSGVWLGSPPSSYVANGMVNRTSRSPSPQRYKSSASSQLLSAEARDRVSRDLAAVEEQLARVARAAAAPVQASSTLDRSVLLFERLKAENRRQADLDSRGPPGITRSNSNNGLESFVATPGRGAISRMASSNALENFVTSPGRIGRALSGDHRSPRCASPSRSLSHIRRQKSAAEIVYEASRREDCSVKANPDFVTSSQVIANGMGATSSVVTSPRPSYVASPLPSCGLPGSMTLPALGGYPPLPTKLLGSSSATTPSTSFLVPAAGDAQLTGSSPVFSHSFTFPHPNTVAKSGSMNLAQSASQLFGVASTVSKDVAQVPSVNCKNNTPVPAPIPVQRRFSHSSIGVSRDRPDKGSVPTFISGGSVRLQGVVNASAPAAAPFIAPVATSITAPFIAPIAPVKVSSQAVVPPCAAPIATSMPAQLAAPMPASRGFPPGQSTSPGLISSTSMSLSSAARAVCAANSVVQARCNPVSNLTRSTSLQSARNVRAASPAPLMSFAVARQRSVSPLPRSVSPLQRLPSPQHYALPRSESRGKLPGLLGAPNLGKIFADSFHEGKFNFYSPAASSPDPLDESFSRCMRRLGLSEQLLGVKRLDAGRYEIDGRRVRLHWKDASQSEVLAVEEDVPDPTIRENPLDTYLNQAARVAQFRFDQGLPTRPSFGNVGAPLRDSMDEDARVSCMNLACEQAKLRAWSRGSSFT